MISRTGVRIALALAAVSALAVFSTIVVVGKRTARDQVQHVELLTDLNRDSRKYDGQRVVVTACVFATEHGVGLMTCDEESDSMLELKFAETEGAKRARDLIMGKVAEKYFFMRPSLPMRATGRFTARRNVGIFELEQADFLERKP